MGHRCAYLATMGGLATGAERVYIPEDGVSLKDLQRDVEMLTAGFQAGKRLGLMISNEYANPVYTTAFMYALFEEEGHDFFDVRPAILGHLQQGGDPSPFDRIQADSFTRLCVEALIQECSQSKSQISFMGMQDGQSSFMICKTLSV